jgi:MarR family transcriptional regulator, temperature-dependent positive regulator of motility
MESLSLNQADDDQSNDRADKEPALADAVFEAVVTNGPLNDAWRLTMWANCFNEPTSAEYALRFDIGRDEFNVLSCLASHGPMAAKTICEVTGRPRNSISRAVNRLAERKMLKRKTNLEDRRESVLILNQAGRRLYEQVLPVAVERQAFMLRHLSEAERAVLDDILNKLMRVRHEW